MRRRRFPHHHIVAGLLAGAIALIAAPVAAQPRQPLPVSVKAFRVTGSPLPEAQLLKVISEAIGQELQPKELVALAERLSVYCETHGFPASRVVLPSQEFRQGVVRFEVVAAITDPEGALLERARLWQGRDRYDFAVEELDKLFKIAPNSVDGMAERVLIDARNNRAEAALAGLLRLRQLDPRHPYIPRIATLVRLNGADKSKLRQARLLARSGRNAAALTAWRNLLAGGQPDGDIALEYWQLVAAAPGGWGPARDGLARLVKENPGKLRYRLLLAEHEAGRNPLDARALNTIIALADDQQLGREAQAAWRRAAMRAPAGPQGIALLRAWVAQDPQDAGARDRLAESIRAEEEHQRLLKDPAYQAKLAGFESLEQGRLEEAEERFNYSLAGRPQDGEAVGGLGMVRLRQGRHAEAKQRFEQALATDTENAGKWRALARTAHFWGLMREAREARSAGEHAEAERKLVEARRVDPRDPDACAALADLYAEQGRLAEAEASYDEALHLEPDHSGALRGLIALRLRTGGDAEGLLAKLSPEQQAALEEDRAADESRRLGEEADALLAAGRVDEAIAALQGSLAAEQRARAGHRSRSVVRVASVEEGDATFAVEPAANPPPPLSSSWQYKRLAGLLDQRTAWVSSAIDWHTRSGTAGVSQLDMVEIPVEYRTPWRDSEQLYVRADAVRVDAGTLDPANADFGSQSLCAGPCPGGATAQEASGIGVAVGYEGGAIAADVGTTPVGFPVANLVGGVARKGDLGDFGYTLELSRRPLTGSLLSFAGARDPRTGRTWGGVVATGARLGLSRDDGGSLGFWSSLGLHRLTGRNVLENDRMQLMAGGYWRVVNEDDRLVSVGLTGMYWRFSENAGEYTFGHGGYYSPQLYESISLPVTWAQRHARFSWQLRASVSASWSETEAAPWYPTDASLQSLAGNPSYGRSSGPGTGHAFSAAGEYQWSPHLFLGGRLELERSEYYAPNRVLFYLRYALDHAAARPVALSPDPVIPTSQF